VEPPQQVTVAAIEDEGRGLVGFAVGFVLYLALTFGGNAIATTVATEKSTRISEVLLAVLRPSQILVGTVLAFATVTLTQLLVLGAPVAIAVQVTDNSVLPPVASGDIALAIMWFLLGFALYAFLYASAGALVDKVTEVNTATAPVAMALLFGYMITIFVVMDDPQSLWSVVASIFPITAPIAMPVRWATGEVPTYQLLLAMALTAGAAAFVALASTIYRRALLMTGGRVRFREVIGSRVLV
jgi:ABC-2 type transport system permease protein